MISVVTNGEVKIELLYSGGGLGIRDDELYYLVLL